MVNPRVFMFHKPKGALVTRSDEMRRRTVYEVLPAWVSKEGWVPVGRLDKDSRGLLLFVREGALVERFGRPGVHRKVYEAWVRGRVTEENISRALEGVETPVGRLSCESARVLGVAGPKTHLEIVLEEGKNRHIRRLFGALSDPERGTPLKVLEIKRVAFGPIRLDVPSGAWRFLTDRELGELFQTGSG